MKKVIQRLTHIMSCPKIMIPTAIICMIFMHVVSIVSLSGEGMGKSANTDQDSAFYSEARINAGNGETDFLRIAETAAIDTDDMQEFFRTCDGYDYDLEPSKKYSFIIYCHNTSNEQLDNVVFALTCPAKFYAENENWIDAVITLGNRESVIMDTLKLRVSEDCEFRAATDDSELIKVYSSINGIHYVRSSKALDNGIDVTQSMSIGSLAPDEKCIVIFDFAAIAALAGQ